LVNRRFLVSSVVRGARQGDSHGGLYVVDFATGSSQQVFDHNSSAINFDGRGADRGLRGIAIDEEKTYVAASDEVFIFSRDFRVIGSMKNPYLRHAHEIALSPHGLFVTSTGYDAILLFNLQSGQAVWGLKIEPQPGGQISGYSFDPQDVAGPAPLNLAHINMVGFDDAGLYLSGLRLEGLYRFDQDTGFKRLARTPLGTHNMQPWGNGFICNDTASNRVVWGDQESVTTIALPQLPDRQIIWTIDRDERIARPYFARGLWHDGSMRAYGGMSPSTLVEYDLDRGVVANLVQLTPDVRNAIHGVCPWTD
jgi:hypothetical protein